MMMMMMMMKKAGEGKEREIDERLGLIIVIACISQGI
jgi:hypothetical protein